jgi:NADPH-dependent curcumin reductase CurA
VAGDFFGASLPFTTIQILTAEAGAKTVMWKLTGKVTESTIGHGIGVLGMPGSTAYGGLIDILRPKEKGGEKPEVIWVSGAAGAVGSMVGQLAKQVYGCTVIGSCGGPAKCALVKDKFGFDHAVDYKAVGGGGRGR